ncbi:MAG TPA: hypothetical protein VFA74_13005 [Terriglobales bacterium]|nr:hypothetical protein [Terriglobales bacterium]
MATIDPEQERRRLLAYYSHLTDDELEQLSKDVSELTEAARQSLATEKAKRGLAENALSFVSNDGAGISIVANHKTI